MSIPSLTVVRTGLFDAFVERNHLLEILKDDPPDDAIARAFQRADLPAELLGDLRALIEQVRTPLAIRSSSMLEDAISEPFAGVYQTKMIPNNQPSPDDRFRRLVEAVKLVWASTFFREARSYLAATRPEERHDRMAVIIQEVVGSRFRDRFYPHISGVARSRNFYPMGRARPEDGVASLALGLGKMIVEGGRCWTYSPALPANPPPFASAAAIVKETQARFWAVNMGRPPAYDPIRETEYLVDCTLQDAEDDGALAHIASTFDPQSGRISPGTGMRGPRVLDFAMLLVLREIPVNDLVQQLLRFCEDELGEAIEIEFAMSFDPHRFGLLQVRPMLVSSDEIDVSDDDLFAEDVIVASDRALGNGSVESIRDIVYLRPEGFDAKLTPRIAAEVEKVNTELGRESRPYLLVGFGRWGSADPWLGVPVNWAQISGARAIVEAMRQGMNVELSQGSHFFHNLTSFRVPYFSIPSSSRFEIDWAWLASLETVSQSALIRHVRSATPIEVRVDGRTGRGIIRRGRGDRGER